jgi:hypothetical protein
VAKLPFVSSIKVAIRVVNLNQPFSSSIWVMLLMLNLSLKGIVQRILTGVDTMLK